MLANNKADIESGVSGHGGNLRRISLLDDDEDCEIEGYQAPSTCFYILLGTGIVLVGTACMAIAAHRYLQNYADKVHPQRLNAGPCPLTPRSSVERNFEESKFLSIEEASLNKNSVFGTGQEGTPEGGQAGRRRGLVYYYHESRPASNVLNVEIKTTSSLSRAEGASTPQPLPKQTTPAIHRESPTKAPPLDSMTSEPEKPAMKNAKLGYSSGLFFAIDNGAFSMSVDASELAAPDSTPFLTPSARLSVSSQSMSILPQSHHLGSPQKDKPTKLVNSVCIGSCRR